MIVKVTDKLKKNGVTCVLGELADFQFKQEEGKQAMELLKNSTGKKVRVILPVENFSVYGKSTRSSTSSDRQSTSGFSVQPTVASSIQVNHLMRIDDPSFLLTDGVYLTVSGRPVKKIDMSID